MLVSVMLCIVFIPSSMYKVGCGGLQLCDQFAYSTLRNDMAKYGRGIKKSNRDHQNQKSGIENKSNSASKTKHQISWRVYPRPQIFGSHQNQTGINTKPNTETRCKEQTACGRSGTGSHSGDSRSSYTLNTPPHLATLLHHLAITSPFI